MKVKSLETFCTQYVGFVRVTADDGSPGWGMEISPKWLASAKYRKSEL
jgi:hypothetical protein